MAIHCSHAVWRRFLLVCLLAASSQAVADKATFRFSGPLELSSGATPTIELELYGAGFDAQRLNCTAICSVLTLVDSTDQDVFARLIIDDGTDRWEFDGLSELSWSGDPFGSRILDESGERFKPALPGDHSYWFGGQFCSGVGGYNGGTVCLSISFSPAYDDAYSPDYVSVSLFVDTPELQLTGEGGAETFGSPYQFTLLDIEYALTNVTGVLTPDVVLPGSDVSVEIVLLGQHTLLGDPIDFDPTRVGPDTVRVGPAKVGPDVSYPDSTNFAELRYRDIDIDNDGDTDRIFGFNIADSRIACDDTGVYVYGETTSAEGFVVRMPLTTSGCDPYTFTDLGRLGRGPSYARDLNNRGEVVGDAYLVLNNDTSSRGFLYRDGVMLNLGTLGAGGAARSEATAINDSSQVVGRVWAMDFPYTSQGFVHENGKTRSVFADHALNRPEWPKSPGIAQISDINKHGTALFVDNKGKLGTWNNGVGRRLRNGYSGDPSWLMSINDQGTVVAEQIRNYAYMLRYLGQWEGVLTPDSVSRQGGFDFLGPDSFLYGDGLGEITCGTEGCTARPYFGFYRIPGVGLLFKTENGSPVIKLKNDFEQFIYQESGFLGQVNGDLKLGDWYGKRPRLNLSVLAEAQGWADIEITAINNLGQIAGSGIYKGRTRSAFLATPEITSVPIDLLPWSSINRLDPRSERMVAIAVFTTRVADGDAADFDATNVNGRMLRFHDGGARNIISPLETDIDGDGDIDAVFGFRLPRSGIECGDTEVFLYGKTRNHVAFIGSDQVVTDCRSP